MSVSGLSKCERAIARDRAVHAALLGLHHASALHYTQSAARWEGIAKGLIARRGEYPTHADCSSFATWCLWNGVRAFDLPDIVNGAGWKAGFTGTLAQHGRQVMHLKNVLPGDLVLYGRAPTYEHVTIVVAVKDDVPMVVSNGSEPGPFFLRYDYRPVGLIKRYI